MINTILSIIKTYKAYLIGALLLGAVILGGKLYIEKVRTDSYDQGVEVATQTFNTQRDQYKIQLADKFKENSELAATLNARTREKEAAVQAVSDAANNKQTIYITTKAAAEKCLDDQLVDIYNLTLGGKQ